MYDEIFILDNLNPFVHKTIPTLEIKARLIAGSIEDSRVWWYLENELTENVNLDILHLASETSTGLSLKQPNLHVKPNILGTSNLIEFMNLTKCKIRKVVLSSSRAIYGEGPWELDGKVVYPSTREIEDLKSQIWEPRYEGKLCTKPLSANYESKPNPCSIYGVTKLAQEQLLSVWCKSNSINFIALRFQNVYGPGQSLLNSYSGILAFFIRQIMSNETIKVFENGEIIRDFVYVDDVSKSLINSLKTEDIQFLIGDVATGISTSLKQVAEMLIDLNKSKSAFSLTEDFRLGDVRHVSCNAEYTWEKLGYKPEIKLSDGLKLLSQWARHELRV